MARADDLGVLIVTDERPRSRVNGCKVAVCVLSVVLSVVGVIVAITLHHSHHSGYGSSEYGGSSGHNDYDGHDDSSPQTSCFDTPHGRKCNPEKICSSSQSYKQKDGSCTECPSPYDRKCDDDDTCENPVNSVNWCDASLQCTDASDLINCIVGCKKNQFRCDLLLSCVAYSKWYDGVTTDCIDDSDEHQSTNPFEGIGDLYDDNSLYDLWDEDSDTGVWNCKSGYKKCDSRYQCIHETYFCDGVMDCLDRSDERRCDSGRHISHKFDCGDGHHIPRRKRCDGHTDCKNGQDEPHDCQCLFGQWKCANSHCIEDSERCNGEDECGDGSDEEGCALDCGVTGHLCGDKCILNTQVCDGNLDCDDLSDEMKCDCTADYRFQCDNGACIRSVFVCNKVDDCTDGSDEKGCPNCEKDGNFQCSSNKMCVPGFVVCDGEHDCPEGEDEQNCETCAGMFECSPHECVDNSKMCDGKVDCSSGLDERNCVRLEESTDTQGSEMLLVARHGNWFPVCSEDYPQNFAEDMCSHMDKGSDGNLTVKPIPSSMNDSVTTQGWMKVSAGYSSTRDPTQNFIHTSTCEDNNAVYISCKPPAKKACGTRSADIGGGASAFIIGGTQTDEGKWPWQVQIYMKRNFICGGAIISDRYILTAAHCVMESKNPSDYQVKLGATKRNGVQVHSAKYDIKRVMQHESFSNKTLQNDVALLKTKTAIHYTDYIRPVCLTPRNQNNLHQSRCYITGWGVYTLFGALPNDLREMRVKLFPSDTCERSIHSLPEDDKLPHVLDEKVVCVGYDLSDTCYGDSGGPLVCRQPDNTFQLIGVTSWGGPPHCHAYTLFTNLTTYVPWVTRHTGINF